MNYPLSKLQTRVAKGVMRADLASVSNNYADYINEALKEFQDKRSWTCMRSRTTVTIPAGATSIALPSDFKELQVKSDGTPINFVLHDPNNPGAVFPVETYYETQEQKRLFVFSGQLAIWFGTLRVFMKRDEAGARIGMMVPAVQDLEFQVDYFKYLPELSASTDRNAISDGWPTMVIAKAKALALSDVNDPVAQTLEDYSEIKYKQASLEDSRADAVGRDLHM